MFVIRTKDKIFGNLGIAWLFPFVFVWAGNANIDRTIRHEGIHLVQWLEVWIVTGPLLLLSFGLKWWLVPATYASYWLVYGILWVVGGHSYRGHAMEVDARHWADRSGRPSYWWLRRLRSGGV